jgi:hypothetical protein
MSEECVIMALQQEKWGYLFQDTYRISWDSNSTIQPGNAFTGLLHKRQIHFD